MLIKWQADEPALYAVLMTAQKITTNLFAGFPRRTATSDGFKRRCIISFVCLKCLNIVVSFTKHVEQRNTNDTNRKWGN